VSKWYKRQQRRAFGLAVFTLFRSERSFKAYTIEAAHYGGNMPTTTQKSAVDYDLAYELSEASVRLEGIDPTESPTYMALRARVIAGEITTDEAGDLLLASYRPSVSAAA